jgi:hypothetical protein
MNRFADAASLTQEPTTGNYHAQVPPTFHSSIPPITNRYEVFYTSFKVAPAMNIHNITIHVNAKKLSGGMRRKWYNGDDFTDVILFSIFAHTSYKCTVYFCYSL